MNSVYQNQPLVQNLRRLLLNLERLADYTRQEQIKDVELVREAVLLLEAGQTENAQRVIMSTSSWAGEISVEIGQM